MSPLPPVHSHPPVTQLTKGLILHRKSTPVIRSLSFTRKLETVSHQERLQC